jgi:hypothetical protein
MNADIIIFGSNCRWRISQKVQWPFRHRTRFYYILVRTYLVLEWSVILELYSVVLDIIIPTTTDILLISSLLILNSYSCNRMYRSIYTIHNILSVIIHIVFAYIILLYIVGSVFHLLWYYNRTDGFQRH